jgi:antitoxin FitA
MPINLSIKNAPEHVVKRLRQRAERNHRSLQGELLAIIEAAAQEDRPANPVDVLADVRRLGVETPSEATSIIRADRDGR